MINLILTWLDTFPPVWGVLGGAMLVLAAFLVAILFAVYLYRADAHPPQPYKPPHLAKVHEKIGAALKHYGQLLSTREGGFFDNNLQWELDGSTVILMASEDCKDVWRLRVASFYFDAPYDVFYVIEDMVWANQDQNDIRDEQVAILNAERAREDTGE